MADVLILGGFTFDGFSPPASMMGGGKQSMIIHKLPGGSRVIDTLGPDDDNVVWEGVFFGDDAYTKALALDAMRSSGQILPLTWGGQFRQVIISNFIYHVRRLSTWVDYSISCAVYRNAAFGGNGVLIAPPTENLILSDLSVAVGI